MGAYVFLTVCTGLWIVFAWTLASQPVVLDRTWSRVRDLPLLAKPVVWVAFFPWLTGLAVWESHWGTPRTRRLAVVFVAVLFIAFWWSTTVGGGESL